MNPRALPLAALVAFAALALTGCKDQCKTACDCPSGYSCLSGTCASGTAAVFCCDKCPTTAPPGQICQHHDGTMSACGKAKASSKP